MTARTKNKSNNAGRNPPQEMQNAGIKVLDGLPWGTHFCQFYKTKKDLLDILVPYFRTGLENNELCVWITSDFLTAEDARAAMAKAVPDFSRYLQKRQIEIFPHTQWYLKEGRFDMDRVLEQWINKYGQGIKAGFEGARVSGNPFWISNKKDWNDFAEYEAGINNVIGSYKLLVLCTYPLDKCGADEILDAVNNHEFAIVKRSGIWTVIESRANLKTKNALQKSERQYRSLFNRMTESFALCEIIYDKKGAPCDYRFIDANPAFEKFIGLKRNRIVGHLRSEIPIPLTPASFATYANTALTGNAACFENYSKALGKQYSVCVYSTARGQFATIFTDITERKLAEKRKLAAEIELKRHAAKLEKAVAELKNLQLAVENASDIIFIADSKGTILSINKAAESILGYETGDIAGKNIALFGSPVDPEFYPKMWRAIKKGSRIFSGEVANMSKDGKKRIFDLKTSPVIGRSGKILFFVGIMRDRTEAKEIDRAKTEFISLAAHQLRTPLATMTMAAEMILNGNIGQANSAAKEQLKNIYDSAYQMSGLIELFLNLSRIELGRLEINPEPIKMEELANDILKDIMPQAQKKKLTLETDFDEKLPIVNIDRRIMHISLENLLTNAVKYTPAGGKIKFAVRVEKNRIISSVTDNGCGIPKNQLPMLFTKMFRADNVGDAKGMGLGLNMAKNSIEQSGGAIFVQSEENKGSTFSISIPLSGMKRKSIRMES
jgi:PAS domain S-box-containing protein